MRAFSSMPVSDLVFQIRQIAINAHAHPLVIDKLDEIQDAPTEEEIEERINEAVEEAEKRAFEGYEKGKEHALQEVLAELERLRTDDPQEIGLTETQIEQLMEWLEL